MQCKCTRGEPAFTFSRFSLRLTVVTVNLSTSMSLNFEHNVLRQRYGGGFASSRATDSGYLSNSPETVTSHQFEARTNHSHEGPTHDEILSKIRGKDLWVVNARKRNGLIINKGFYTEFAGPGAAIGGGLDTECNNFTALGSLSLISPKSAEEQQKALRIRLQWVRLTQNFTDKPDALERAQLILEQFKSYFDQGIVKQVPDEAFAMLVGVFPSTIRKARSLL